ncbi:PAP2 superfamily-domain-containing protein [Lanmaoa asiatica]|nr:PAP2 superfamily-domain-containing protein [Lanmaoa asiatica]
MTNRVSLDLTHVLYDASSDTSLVLALFTLSPILLMPAYAALAVQTRELTIINMWAGQLFSEALNWILKHIIKEERPNGSNLHLNGYGFPSSHSQYMGYFGAFLICHVYFRHRFASCGYPLLDQAFRLIVYLCVLSWVVLVAYSRLSLLYHTPRQVIWGLGIGTSFGVVHYILTELLPYTRPLSVFGRVRATVLAHPVVTWMQVRDGWAIWADGGRETEWKRWKTTHDEQWTRIIQKRVN